MFSQANIPADQQPRIVAVTGHVEAEYVNKALKCGMDKVFSKPLSIKEFGKLLMQMQYIQNVP